MDTMNLDYQKLATELLAATARKAVSSTPTTVYGHGSGGLFSSQGMERPVFSAMMLPRMGLQSMLPVRSNNATNPLYGIITGVTATTGSEADGVCDDPPVAGLTKLCTHSFVFGRQSRMSRVFDIDRMGVITNRGEFTDLQVLGQPFNNVGGVPTIAGSPSVQNAAQNEVAKALFELATAWSRDFARSAPRRALRETASRSPSSSCFWPHYRRSRSSRCRCSVVPLGSSSSNAHGSDGSLGQAGLASSIDHTGPPW